MKRLALFGFGSVFMVACLNKSEPTNTPPTVRIISPEDGTIVDHTELLGLYAYAYDDEDAAQDLIAGWNSDIDGQITSVSVDADNFSEINIGMLTAGTHQITVVVMDTSGATGEDTLSLIVNGPPSQPQIAFSPQEPRSSDDFSVVFDTPSEDPEGLEVTYAYEWRVDGGLFADLSGPTIGADLTIQGQVWSVTVTPSDGRIDGEPATAEVEIINAVPTQPEIAILPEEFDPGPDLIGVRLEDRICVLVTESTDGDGDDITYTVEWTVDGVAFTEAVDTNLVGDTVPAAYLQTDETWTCTVTPSDEFDVGESATASLLVEYPDLILDASAVTLVAGSYAFGDVTLLNASTLFVEGEVTIRSSTFHVGSSSNVNGYGAGEAGSASGSIGSGAGGGGAGVSAGAGGGGYGGDGGLGGYDGSDTPGPSGSAYGSADVYEIFMGSGGGQSGSSSGGVGGDGGGGFMITSESITVDGIIDVSGEAGAGGASCGSSGTTTCTYGGGGGSGGGVLLHGDTVEVDGGISAWGGTGGTGNDAGGGGAGGRVKVFWNTSLAGTCSTPACWQVSGGAGGNDTDGKAVALEAQGGGTGTSEEAQIAWP